MAFAIASGLKPEAGLFTAIIAGFLISALGGSRVQIGGPAGAFIVIVYGIVERYGLANLIIATAMSGVMLFAMGVFKLGNLLRLIPVSVVIGFTNGITVLIALSQVKDFLGLSIPAMPADFFGMIGALSASLPSTNGHAALVAACGLGLLVAWTVALPRMALRHAWARKAARVPGTVVLLLVSTLVVSFLSLPVDTIGSRFGGIPSGLPSLVWPEFSWATARFLLIPAATLALLGAIESLLCARVADSMIDDRHDPNQELMAQGIANFVVPFFAGMPATGTIARTVTNIKSGANSPVAGIVHSVTLLLVILLLAPLAQHIPLASLSAILMFVAWNMGEWREFIHLRQYRMPYRVTLLSVFVLTVVFDLTVAVEVGLVAACTTFIYRISSLSRSDKVDLKNLATLASHRAPADHGVEAWRMHGALFFGTVQLVKQLQDQLPKKLLLLDLKNVIYVDSSGADTLIDLAKSCKKSGIRLVLTGLANQPKDICQRCGLVRLLGESDVLPDVRAGLTSAGYTLERSAGPMA